jgi:hypothetical protein
MSASININSGAGNSGSAASANWTLGVQRRDRKIWTTIRERVDADIAVLELTSVELEDMLKQLVSIALPNSRIRGEVCDLCVLPRSLTITYTSLLYFALLSVGNSGHDCSVGASVTIELGAAVLGVYSLCAEVLREGEGAVYVGAVASCHGVFLELY